MAGPLRVELLRSGTNASRLDVVDWTRQPFSVVGFVRKGAFELEVADGPSFIAEPGGAYLVPGDTPFRSRALEPGLGEYVWSHINIHLLAGIELTSLMRLDRCIPAGPAAAQRVERVNQAIAARLTGDGQPAWDATSPPDPPTFREAVELQRLGLELFEVLITHARLTDRAAAVLSAHERLSPVLAYVQTHLDEPITRAELARVARLSESRFHVVFSKAMGAAPMEYVTQARLRQAQAMLSRNDLPVAQIGQACGYPDAFHFSRQFKQHVGMSPSAYRQQQRQPRAAGL